MVWSACFLADLCCFGVFVAEPQRDHGDVGPGVKQGHGSCVPKDVGRDGLAAECGACGLRGTGVPGNEQLDRVAAERLPAAGREQRVGWLAAAFI
jgi:hypothetical protein